MCVFGQMWAITASDKSICIPRLNAREIIVVAYWPMMAQQAHGVCVRVCVW